MLDGLGTSKLNVDALGDGFCASGFIATNDFRLSARLTSDLLICSGAGFAFVGALSTGAERCCAFCCNTACGYIAWNVSCRCPCLAFLGFGSGGDGNAAASESTSTPINAMKSDVLEYVETRERDARSDWMRLRPRWSSADCSGLKGRGVVVMVVEGWTELGRETGREKFGADICCDTGRDEFKGETGREVIGEIGCSPPKEDVALYTLPTSANSVAAGEASDTDIRLAEEMGIAREVTEASAAALAPKAKRALARGESERVG